MSGNHSTVLVTGGAGFIGSHLVDRLLKEGFEVTVIDNLQSGNVENVAHHEGRKGFCFVKGDIRDVSLVDETVKDADVVFHEAAFVSAALSVENPLITNEINVTGTLNLLKASADLDVKRFVYASSAAVYGEASPPQKKETMAPQPTSPYGVSKLAAENYVQLFHQLYGIETVSLRYFNVYGPRQSFDVGSAYGGVITLFTNRLLENVPPIIYGDGEQTRDFVFVHDVVDANLLALNTRKAAGKVFNIGTGRQTSINQLAETLKNITNRKDLKSVYSDPRPGDPRHGYANIAKAKKVLGYEPRYSLQEGLGELIKWYLNKQS